MTDSTTLPTKGDNKTAARVIAGAMIIGGFVGLYYHWQFAASFNPSNGDPNILGTGWVLEAAFWALRSVPGAVLCAIGIILGALALHGMALPAKAERGK